MAVVVVSIAFPCPSGSSCTDWRASAKAMAPLRPICPNNEKLAVESLSHICHKLQAIMELTTKTKCFLML